MQRFVHDKSGLDPSYLVQTAIWNKQIDAVGNVNEMKPCKCISMRVKVHKCR